MGPRNGGISGIKPKTSLAWFMFTRQSQKRRQLLDVRKKVKNANSEDRKQSKT